ncbi:glycosyltransferase [Vibrio comitans]|uniref:Colanic acid biosynthesis glycosyltransferase WcaL n=1 Tax=Vibrio comitans NBRC 102076 TaxID=1219078 RepID=A0A4Y3IR85_9VIBR|nr:glycosyltransferase [Vibrio comitans]GEA62003.1 colanic acid biosynthesis glycosyltransferase WcaL [Vibrio comitans NBRC 102076]
MRVGVYSNRFPEISQTFVTNQISNLIKHDVDVRILCDNLTSHSRYHRDISDENLLDICHALEPCKKNKYRYFAKTLMNVFKGISVKKIKFIMRLLLSNELMSSQKLKLLNMYLYKDTINDLDVILVHFGHNGYCFKKFKDLVNAKFKIFTIFHGYEISSHQAINKYSAQYKALGNEKSHLLTVNELWKKRLISLGCKQSYVSVCRLGIDDELFTEVKPFIRREKLRIVQVGRLTEKKAILDSIAAVIKARETVDLEFVIIGEGELYSRCSLLIEDNNASDYIKLLGSKTQEEVNQTLTRSDVFILPSVTSSTGDMEGIPVALMEAMAKGLVVISTYHSGIPELIDENCGFLVKEHDVEALSEKIKLINKLSEGEIDELRKNAVDKCYRNFRNSKNVKLLVEKF